MRWMQRTGSAVAMAAMLVAALPATAQDRGGGDRGGGDRRSEHRDDRRRDEHHRRDRRDERRNEAGGVGGFVVGAAVMGLVATLTARKQPVAAEPASIDLPPPPPVSDADAAVAACARAAEEEGRRRYPLAQVGQVRLVDPVADGFAVQGDMVLRGGWRDAGERRTFRCSVDASAVRRVAIDGVATLPPPPFP